MDNTVTGPSPLQSFDMTFLVTYQISLSVSVFLIKSTNEWLTKGGD